MARSAEEVLEGLTYGDRDADADERLRRLILYVAERSFQDESFGSTKLNKLLYFIDFRSFARSGQSISGAEYMSLPQGPVPKRLVHIRDGMVKRHQLHLLPTFFHDRPQKKPIALVSVDVDSSFTPREVSLIDAVISEFWGRTAADLSALSHDRIWKIYGTEGASIPKEAVFVSSEPSSPYDVRRSEELAEKYGWGLEATD